MLVSLSLCHNVIIEEDEQGHQKYNASSPDELAFINMAKLCGWEYLGLNSSNELCVRTGKGEVKYKLLHMIEFDSDRKRMSVIMEKDDKVVVYCKGADNIITSRLKNKDSKTSRAVAERIGEWSRQGLRTLLFARREIDKNDYQKWAKMYASSLSKL
jgi:magnesium-transporting ATPase (P-type)